MSAENQKLLRGSKRCDACGAPIHFIRTHAGKLIPCEHRRRTVVTLKGATVQGYESHFAACPEAARFRKGRDG